MLSVIGVPMPIYNIYSIIIDNTYMSLNVVEAGKQTPLPPLQRMMSTIHIAFSPLLGMRRVFEWAMPLCPSSYLAATATTTTKKQHISKMKHKGLSLAFPTLFSRGTGRRL